MRTKLEQIWAPHVPTANTHSLKLCHKPLQGSLNKVWCGRSLIGCWRLGTQTALSPSSRIRAKRDWLLEPNSSKKAWALSRCIDLSRSPKFGDTCVPTTAITCSHRNIPPITSWYHKIQTFWTNWSCLVVNEVLSQSLTNLCTCSLSSQSKYFAPVKVWIGWSAEDTFLVVFSLTGHRYAWAAPPPRPNLQNAEDRAGR